MRRHALNEGQDYIPATTLTPHFETQAAAQPLNEGQDYIPATTVRTPSGCGNSGGRSMRARIISRLQLLPLLRTRNGLQALNEGQDYIPATTRTCTRPRQIIQNSLNEGQDYIPATTHAGWFTPPPVP